MRRFSFLFILILFYTIGNAQQVDQKDFNGWEFLKWGLTKKQVKAELLKRNLLSPSLCGAGPTWMPFFFNNMGTNLEFGVVGLKGITQDKYFREGEKIIADSAFIKEKKRVTEQYGVANPNTYVGKDTI